MGRFGLFVLIAGTFLTLSLVAEINRSASYMLGAVMLGAIVLRLIVLARRV